MKAVRSVTAAVLLKLARAQRLGPARTLATSSSSAAHSLRRLSSRAETGADIATNRA